MNTPDPRRTRILIAVLLVLVLGVGAITFGLYFATAIFDQWTRPR